MLSEYDSHEDIWNFLLPSTDEIKEVTPENPFIIFCYEIRGMFNL
jgi:hypothetical protein